MEISWAIDALKGNTTTLVTVGALIVVYVYVIRPICHDVLAIVRTLDSATKNAKDAAAESRAVVQHVRRGAA